MPTFPLKKYLFFTQSTEHKEETEKLIRELEKENKNSKKNPTPQRLY
ncbi:MAG: hypothetical protein NZ853_02795 [Leptospiraceae bacterium]|nr:hypothetical protein [Leptospiraceae bacterium]